MIILKFTDGKAQVATINKPSFYEGIWEILKEVYTETIAERNANEIDKYIQDNMQFPKDGVYCIENGLFNRFDSDKNDWHCTAMSPIEYVITPDASIWKCFENEFLHLQDMSEQIKESVKYKTEEMFDSGEWRSISSIDSRNWKAYSTSKGIVSILEDFFKKEKAIELSNAVRRQLFGIEDSDIVIIQDGWHIKSAITANDVRVFDENNIKKVEQIFRGKLKQSEIIEVMTRLKNLLCFGQDISIGEIIGYNDEGDEIVKYKGYEIVFILGDPYIKVDESVYTDIKKVVDSIDFHHGVEKDRYGFEFMGSTEIDLTIPAENGISLVAERDNRKLQIARKIPDAYGRWNETFVELKYVNGREQRTYYKEEFIGHYVCVKL